MNGSKDASESDMSRVKPIALSKRSIWTIVVTAILFWSSAIFLFAQGKLDKWLLISPDGLRANEAVISVAQLFSKYGMASIVLIYFVYLLFAFKYEKLRDASPIYLVVLLMFAFAGFGGDILKEIIDRPRPFIEYAGEFLAFSTAGTPAFPSGHATKSVALALPFLILVPARDIWHKGVKILLAGIALGVCTSRVLLGAHYVSDVLAGIGMALICFPWVTLLTKKIMSKWTQKRLDFAIKIWAVAFFAFMIILTMI
jgi:membrane-associated phospholipid phosphatase